MTPPGAAAAASPQTILDRIAAQVRERPRAAAVRFDGQELDYATLWQRARAIAWTLQQQGCAAEARVGILLPRSLELVPALLGTLLAGACYLPLEPRFPAERLDWMARHAGVRHILTLGTAGAELANLDAVCTDLRTPLPAPPAGWHSAAPLGGQAAYALYTSGSTGRPKGVINTHEALLNRLDWMQQAYALQPGERVLQKTPFTFDVSVWEFFWPLMEGACQVLALPEGHRDFAYLAGLIEAEQVSRLHFVPSMLEGFLASLQGRRLDSLRQIVCSGEALPTPVAEQCLALLPRLRLDNLYGPTEAAIDVSFHACAVGESVPSQPIGEAISGIDLHVLDSELRPVADGEQGELFIGGIGLARGYLARPDLTAERFIPHVSVPGQRLYRTGDLVCRRAGGSIDYLGRLDFQVKINGQRIELGEIENVLREHAEVAAAVVSDVAAAGGRRQLAAWVTLRQGAALRRASADRCVATWRSLYEQVYAGLEQAGADPRDNFLSWNSSYDGQPLPLADMRRWADEAAARILATAPRRVLEIGCGSGLIASRLAAALDGYVGLDPSPAALRYLGARLAPEQMSRISLVEGFAHALPDAGGVAFDAVVLNSVVQYFPDAEYLSEVLDAALARLAPGGSLFVGDVRDARLLPAFAASLAALAGENLRDGRDRRCAQETELLLDPAFFGAWAARHAGVSCELLPKTGAYDNELARFRYDVRLRRGGDVFTAAAQCRWIDLPDWPALAARAAQAGSLQVDGVPLPRLAAPLALTALAEANAQATVEEFTSLPVAGLDPAALDALLAAQGLRAEWRLDEDQAGLCRVLLLAAEAPAVQLPASSAGVASAGMAGGLRAELSRDAADALKPWLAGRLPAYMVPAHLLVLDALPLNSNGKVDRKQLPAPLLRETFDAGVHAQPETPAECALAAIWASLLQLEQVPADVSFYRLGGDSILLAQLVMRASAQGLALDLATAIAHPTVIGMAAALENRTASTAAVTAAPGFSAAETQRLADAARRHGRAVEKIVPLADFIAGMLGLGARAAMPGVNVEVVSFEAEALDATRFAAAWQAVIARHEILRSGFSFALPGRAAQIVYEAAEVTIEHLDWRGLDAEAQQQRWDTLYDAAWRQRFDLEAAPLMRLQAVRLDETRSRVLWVLHHALTDGWSYAVVLDDLLRAYRGETLPAAALAYSEFSAWLRGNDRGAALRDYWRGYLRGYAPAEGSLPQALPEAGREASVLCREASLDASARRALDGLLARHEVTWNALVEVFWGALLARLGERQRVAFGSLASLRPLGPAGSDALAGPAFNVLPVRYAAGDGAALARVRAHFATRAQHFAHAQAHPLLLQEAAGLGADQALFESVLVFENIPAVAGDPLLQRLRFDSRSDRPLVLLVWPGEALRLELYGDSGRFSGAWLDARLADLVQALARLAADGNLDLGDCFAWPGAAQQAECVLEVEI
jgi:amino acid adenylation domain-containing protein